MSTRVSPRVRGYSVLVAFLLVAGLAGGRIEALAVAAPMLTLLVVGLALARTPRLEASASLDRDHVLEGEPMTLHLTVTCEPRPPELEVRLPLAQGLAAGSELPRLLRPSASTEDLELQIEAARWGGHRLQALHLTAHDRLGLYAWRLDAPLGIDLRVYPRPESVRRLLRPLDTQRAAGANLSRARGEGMELADIAAYQPGDQVRRVNWRASARRGSFMVNRRHPERSSDVIVFLDSYASVGTAERSTLLTSVRVAAALARAHLQQRDRVGVIGWGAVLRWLQPGSGTAQAYRILDALIDTQVQVSYAWRGIAHVPARTLRANAQVIAVSPLADERSVDALLDLAARGRDLAIVEIPPAEFLPPPAGDVEAIARRLYEARRGLLRDRLAAAGIPLATWAEDRPVTVLLDQLDAFRRSVRTRRPA
ncbi:MAG TPA: DUF58 domain-containing protein [Candidatus Dormibacteraeota bacterium]|nr:DUF58 domain-containing protein [Candidatus Dormibacteraeota bacterium]